MSKDKDHGSEKVKITGKGTLDPERAAAYIGEMLEGVREGRLRVEGRDKSISLAPDASLDVEVTAMQKADRQRLVFELAWKRDPASETTSETAEASQAEGGSCVVDRMREMRDGNDLEAECAERNFMMELFGGYECHDAPPC